MHTNQILGLIDKKKRRNQYKENLYCTHPIHTIPTRGRPIKISREQFKDHHCIARKCEHLFVDKSKAEQ